MIFRNIFMALILAMLASGNALAQSETPTPPEPVLALESQGAQLKYLGRQHGFDGWVALKNGQEQYFYVPPGGNGFVMGILFDNDGKVATIDQVRKIQGDSVVGALEGNPNVLQSQPQNKDTRFDASSPSERLYHDIVNSNWITLGYPSAPIIYAFIDPQCPHCHATINQMQAEGLFDRGVVQMRLIPVGFSQETKAQAAFLLAAPKPQERFLRHLAGDEEALPINQDINTQGVDRNMAVMQAWKFDVTPMLVYRDKADKVKIVRGRPSDLDALVSDLPAAQNAPQ